MREDPRPASAILCTRRAPPPKCRSRPPVSSAVSRSQHGTCSTHIIYRTEVIEVGKTTEPRSRDRGSVGVAQRYTALPN